MIQSVSILGCGWLGLPLAKFLVEKGFQVSGSTTRAEKLEMIASEGVRPFLLNFTPKISGDAIESFLNSELLVIDIPPKVGSSPDDFHVKQMQELKSYITESNLKYIIYVSATSVYPETGNEFVEEDVTSVEQAENKTLFKAEEIFRSDKNYNTTIIRCAGLVGYDRNPARYFAGKTNVKGGFAPVNLIHRDDVIEIIFKIIAKDYWNETLNISSPMHPLRNDFYPYITNKFGLSAPQFDESDQTKNKIISIMKLQKDLNYSFKFPDPKEFYYMDITTKP